jgi:serine/threonine protein kinase
MAVPSTGPEAQASEALVERVIQELTERWHKNERPHAEEYLALYPELAADPEAALEVIYAELCLRQEESPAEALEADLLRRFPQWRRQLEVLLDCHRLLEDAPSVTRFPAVGEELGDFHLLAELGRGAQGRVFLAAQASLADRLLVLKLVPRTGQEHLALARLQHTNIVPLYFVQDDPDRDLRALSLPYFGGATLARLFEGMGSQPPMLRTGRHLLDALHQTQVDGPGQIPVSGPACEFLGRVSYVQAVCWLGACLADALQYAHERGLVHLDLKPSNVLLAADGQPMLLDFHLAREPLLPGTPAPAWLGGTLAYMPPEQRAALAAVQEGQPVSVAVDGRADIYALGALLYEALGGRVPVPVAAPARALRRQNPQVTVGLADLLGKCLAADPQRRYAAAAAVAADLRRHLADLPLQGVANRSLAERLGKWRRRSPFVLPLIGLLLPLLAASGLGLAHVERQLHRARSSLAEGIERTRSLQFAEAVAVLKGGLSLVEDLPWNRGLATKLRTQLRRARQGLVVEDLHRFVELLRFVADTEHLATNQVRDVEEGCRRFWEQRDLIRERLSPLPNTELAQTVETDLLDLVILWTELRVRLAGGAAGAAVHQEALDVLAQAEALFGPSCMLYHERRVHATALGLTSLAAQAEREGQALAPRSAWEHYVLGRALLRNGKLDQAASYFERALALQPQGLWPYFYQGKCAYERGRYADAVSAFTACVALAPQSGWCLYNRGLAYAALDRRDEALRDFDRALEKGAEPAAVHYGRALIRLAQGDRAGARLSLDEALRYNPEHKDANTLRDSLSHR